MTLPYPPPWMDKITLAEHICVSDRTVDAWVRAGLLPAPRSMRGKLMWKWAEVDSYLDRANQNATASDPFSEEAIRERTYREVANVRSHRY